MSRPTTKLPYPNTYIPTLQELTSCDTPDGTLERTARAFRYGSSLSYNSFGPLPGRAYTSCRYASTQKDESRMRKPGTSLSSSDDTDLIWIETHTTAAGKHSEGNEGHVSVRKTGGVPSIPRQTDWPLLAQGTPPRCSIPSTAG